MRKIKSLLLATLLAAIFNSQLPAQTAPIRQFRGTWMHTVGQSRYKEMSSLQMKSYLIESLDQLQAMGINALLFQVRPTADAFYISDLEPWSNFLTGKQGVAPWPIWDPMAFLIEECHKRNIEFHAWMNPYRITFTATEDLHPEHIARQHPEWTFKYEKKLYFDPGIPQCKEFIKSVVKDVVRRYDVDAIHFDDYFYPYPAAGVEIPDQASFEAFGLKQGFTKDQKADWRRNNVNILIKELNQTIKGEKPWVRFGISPFGIYRNLKETPQGSNTNGLTNYDGLYADIKLWVKNNWIDYNIPQLYWEIDHPRADYAELIRWWPQHNYGQQLYIGQSISRTMEIKNQKGEIEQQLDRKMKMELQEKEVHGHCWWHVYELLDNYKGVADSLKAKYHKYPALNPAYTNIDNVAPAKVKSLKAKWSEKGYALHWTAPKAKGVMDQASYYGIYRFDKGEAIDLNNPFKLIALRRTNSYLLPWKKSGKEYVYVITALDKCNNQSEGCSIKVKL